MWCKIDDKWESCGREFFFHNLKFCCDDSNITRNNSQHSQQAKLQTVLYTVIKFAWMCFVRLSVRLSAWNNKRISEWMFMESYAVQVCWNLSIYLNFSSFVQQLQSLCLETNTWTHQNWYIVLCVHFITCSFLKQYFYIASNEIWWRIFRRW